MSTSHQWLVNPVNNADFIWQRDEHGRYWRVYRNGYWELASPHPPGNSVQASSVQPQPGYPAHYSTQSQAHPDAYQLNRGNAPMPQGTQYQTQYPQYGTPRSQAMPPPAARIVEAREAATLDTAFARHNQPRRFFVLGRVFQTLWSQPAGSHVDPDDSAFSLNTLREGVYSKVTRFIVVREGHESCTAIMIHTYRKRGLARTGLKKSDHGIVYTGDTVPAPQREELGSGDAMVAQPVKVVPKRLGEKLDPLSRINYAKVYTVEHNVKVKEVGQICPTQKALMLAQHKDICERSV